mgnify:CR=1 FL=1
MICKKDLEKVMGTLLNKEIDTEVILNAIADYCNKSKEFISSLLTFRVIQATNSDGHICKGMINLGNEYIWVNLDRITEASMPKYIY